MTVVGHYRRLDRAPVTSGLRLWTDIGQHRSICLKGANERHRKPDLRPPTSANYWSRCTPMRP